MLCPALYLSRWTSRTQKTIFVLNENTILMDFIKFMEATSRALSCVKRMVLKRYNTIYVAHVFGLLRLNLNFIFLYVFRIFSKSS